MRLTSAETHTVDEDLLTPGGYVLDAGCRDFLFAKYMSARGCRVVSLDPDPAIVDPKLDNIKFLPAGLAASSGPCDFVLMENVEARHLSTAGFTQWSDVSRVPATSINVSDLMAKFDIALWDCTKMDIEGSEYAILLNWPGPIAKQITVEFHEHLEKRPKELYDQIFNHLGKWYNTVQKSDGDTLLVLK